MKFNQTVEISKDVLAQEVSGETVLLDLEGESYFGLDEVGTRIWQLLQEHGSVQKAYEMLLVEYDVEAEQLEKDMEDIISKLEAAGLISIGK